MYIHGVGERDGYKAPGKREKRGGRGKRLKGSEKKSSFWESLVRAGCEGGGRRRRKASTLSREEEGAGEEIIVLRNESNSREEMEKERRRVKIAPTRVRSPFHLFFALTIFCPTGHHTVLSFEIRTNIRRMSRMHIYLDHCIGGKKAAKSILIFLIFLVLSHVFLRLGKSRQL